MKSDSWDGKFDMDSKTPRIDAWNGNNGNNKLSPWNGM